jgi:hypothetical protein
MMKNLLSIIVLCFILPRVYAQTCTPQITCNNAPLFCGLSLQNQIFNNAVPVIPGAFNPLCGPNFTTHNSNWYRIIPCTPNLSLEINVLVTSTGDGLQTALYAGCNSNATVACNPGVEFGAFMPLVLNATVVPGQEYYLQIDGFAADICSYTITVNSGLDILPPSPPVGPFNGNITSIPAGPAFCSISGAQFSVDWPQCDAFQSPQLSCYEPKEDSCKGIKWTLPKGSIVIGDPYANPITVDFHNVLPGNYTIKARPMDCACPNNLCPECGQICCPVNEVEYPITIFGPSITVLPNIEVCLTDWPPACALASGGSVNGYQAFCQTEDPALCHVTVQPFSIPGAVVNNQGIVTICANDTLYICDSTFTLPGTYTSICSCDSAVVVTVVKDLACSHDCANYNFPTPPGDHCAVAPFLCGNYLDGYCSSNFGFDSDTLAGLPIGNAGFLRLSPCTDSIYLELEVRNCQQNTGMKFWLMAGNCTAPQLFTPTTILNNSQGALSLFSVLPDSTYYFVFAGIAGDECEFSIAEVGGIGTATPGITSCSCTGGGVDGPGDVCPGDIVSYTLTPSQCTVTSTPSTGGNGYYCCPDEEADSLHLIWHIPLFMSFIGDSVDVFTITVVVNPDLIGVDTFANDSVWVSYETGTPGNNPALDTLVFCDCPAVACTGSVGTQPVYMHHIVNQYYCELTCSNAACLVDGQVYTAPGIFTTQTNCETKIVVIVQNINPPSVFIAPPATLTCIQTSVTLVANTFPGNSFVFWSGPGIMGQSNNNVIQVNQPGQYICNAINPSNGCVGFGSIFVTQNVTPPTATAGANKTICLGESTTLNASSNVPGAAFHWSSGQSLATITVTPGATTTYVVTVTNSGNGCTKTASVTVTVNPVQINQLGEVGLITCNVPCVSFMGNSYCTPGNYEIQENPCLIRRFSIGLEPIPPPVIYPPVQLCNGECYTFFGQTYCSSTTATYEENCTLYVQEISVLPPLIVDIAAPIPVCAGETAIINASSNGGTVPYFYQWNDGQTGSIIGVSPPITTIFTVTVTDGNACTSTAETIMVINNLQIVQSGIVGTVSCNAPCFTFMGNTYCQPGQYSVGENCIQTNFEIGFAKDTVNVGIAGTITCSQNCVVFQNQSYCQPGIFSNSDSCTVYLLEITVNVATPAVTVAVPPVLTCLVTSAPLVAFTDPDILVNWSGSGISGLGNNGISVSIPGVYSCMVTDPGNGCTSTATVVVAQDIVPPLVIAGPDTTICQGSSVMLMAISNTPQSAYLWNTGQSSSSIIDTPIATTIYVVTVTNIYNGCVNSATATVTINPPMMVNVLPEITICPGQAANIAAAATGGTAPYFYMWNTGDSSATFQAFPQATTMLTVTVTDITGCTATAGVLLIVNTLQVIQAGTVGHVSCSNPCFSFMGTIYCLPGQYTNIVNCTQTNFEIAFAKDTVNAGTVGTITCVQNCVSFQNQNYCQSGNYAAFDSCTVYHFVVAANLAPPVCTSPSLNCLPGNNNYTVGFSIGGTQPYKINGTPIIGSYYLSEPVPSGDQYNFIVEQTTNGCQVLLSGIYDCTAMCTGATASLAGNTTEACTDATVAAAVITPALPGVGQIALFYLHDGSAGNIGTVLAKNDSGIFTFHPANMQPEVLYYISSVVGPMDAAGGIDRSDACALVSLGQPIVFHALPRFTGIETVQPRCFGDMNGEIMITAEGADPFEFSTNNHGWIDDQLLGGLGAGIYHLTARDVHACLADSTVILIAPDAVWLYLGPDQDIIKGESILLSPSTNAIAPVFDWEDDQSPSIFSGESRTVQPDQTTIYSCTVTDGNGCTAVSSVQVRVRPDGLFAPNVITPETGDPVNQHFTLFAQEGYVEQIISMEIYDRWGSSVFMRRNFAANDPSLGWDGTFKGKLLRPDVFTFLAIVQLYDGSTKTVKGDVTVIR